MNEKMEVMKPDALPVGVAIKEQEFNAGQMMHIMIQAGITTENVAAFKELVLLQERGEDRKAKREFAAAFSALQAEMPAVQAMKPVPNRDGTVRYKYAPYEDILKQIKPYLDKHGFSLRFSQKSEATRITMVCTLLHNGGHSETNEFSCRIGQGPPSSNESQADGAASSYAQRGALCDALNIVVRTDSDARLEGGNVTQEQADELERRVKLTNSDVKKFLAFAEASTFETIKSAKYPVLDDFISRKEGRR